MTAEPAPSTARRRRSTSTSAFGVGRRESHDASGFYGRFVAPELSDDDAVYGEAPDEHLDLGDGCFVGDSRETKLPDNSVALVVTSPPYFVGKEYEEAVERGEIPSSYEQYLEMLEEVFLECKRVLEPGGRIAINVANLGRKPYRSLSADLIAILENRLGLLMRGEIIWRKGKGTSGSCAWGSYKQATNPVLRDTTERVLIASKGRFDRAKSLAERQKLGLPYESTISADEFMDATLDVWEIDAESARRVKHPAPFPVELPTRLINLYTYRNDRVLDPFLGSGTTLVAARREHRQGIGFDLDPAYVAIAKDRVASALPGAVRPATTARRAKRSAGATTEMSVEPLDFQARATREGKKAQDIAERVLRDAGFDIVDEAPRLKSGVQFNFKVAGGGFEWFVDVSGAFTTVRPGLQRTDTLWKTLGRLAVLKSQDEDARLLILTSNLPRRGSEGDKALHAVGGRFGFFDAVEMYDQRGLDRLAAYATDPVTKPLAGFWSDHEISRDWS